MVAVLMLSHGKHCRRGSFGAWSGRRVHPLTSPQDLLLRDLPNTRSRSRLLPLSCHFLEPGTRLPAVCTDRIRQYWLEVLSRVHTGDCSVHAGIHEILARDKGQCTSAAEYMHVADRCA